MIRGSKTAGRSLGAVLDRSVETLRAKLPREAGAFAFTAVLLLVVFPLSLSGFRLAMGSSPGFGLARRDSSPCSDSPSLRLRLILP